MEESSSKLLTSRVGCETCVHDLILLAKKSLCIISQGLEPELYNNRDIYDHLSNLATTNRKTDIRIIAHDTRVAANQGHFLISLAQKLPSFAQIRTTVTREDKLFYESWLIADDMAYMRIKSPARFEGIFEADNRIETKTYLDRFEKIWGSCQIDQNTRRLSL